MAKRRPRHPPSPSGKEIAATLAATGATVVGGKLLWDRLRGDSGHEPSRAYRLEADEFVPDGIRRVARGQLDNALEDLGGAHDGELAETVHKTRKRIKRLRASLRLARAGIGDDAYRGENAALRDAGRRLSGVRDAKVLVETLDGLSERFRDELPAEATTALRARLEREHDLAIRAMHADGARVGRVYSDLSSARERTAAWTFETDGFDALAPGLRRIYRRGRRRMREAAAEPTTEHFHEWRKSVKDLWHAAQILRPAGPKRMKRLSKRAHRLSTLLGDDHDLAVLSAYVTEHPDCFPDAAAEQALEAVIVRRREALQREALDRGAKLYERSPKQFVRWIERGWRKRTPKQRRPLAA